MTGCGRDARQGFLIAFYLTKYLANRPACTLGQTYTTVSCRSVPLDLRACHGPWSQPYGPRPRSLK
jgi:hypothetical protein